MIKKDVTRKNMKKDTFDKQAKISVKDIILMNDIPTQEMSKEKQRMTLMTGLKYLFDVDEIGYSS